MLNRGLLIIFLIMVAVACAAPAEEVAQQEETAVPTLPPTAPPPTATTAPTSSATAEPTATLEPTETPIPATPTAEPTATPEPPPTATATPTIAFTSPRFSLADRFTIYGDETAVSRGSEQYTDPGAAVFHDGQFHMFHNIFTGWPAPVSFAYSVSDDGISWTRVQEEPVFSGDELDYVGFTALASSVLVREDGTWLLYFYTWDERSWPASTGSIGVATATDPLGPWTAADASILTPGEAGEWDSDGIRVPSVVATEDGYIMYYAGYNGNMSAIGRATSSDGFTWTKHDDPETADSPYAQSDPVFGSGNEGWDRFSIFQPRVVRTGDGWVLLYAGATNVARSPINNKFGLAISEDGVDWTRTDAEIFAPSDFRSSAPNIWFSELVYTQGTYFVYVELQLGGNTEIYVATVDEPLLTDKPSAQVRQQGCCLTIQNTVLTP